MIGKILTVLLVLFLAWLYWKLLRRSEEPAKVFGKTVCTILILVAVFWMASRQLSGSIGTLSAGSIASAMVLVGLVALGFLIIAMIWMHPISDFLARPFEALFTGGFDEPDPEPVFGPATARRKMDKPREAIAELRRQLDRFPGHFDLLLLQAEIEAQDLKDLSAARDTIRSLVAEPAHPPGKVALALNSLADWELQTAHNAAGAYAALKELEERYPDTQIALDAAQRIAHLPTQGQLDERIQGRRIRVTTTPRDRIISPQEIRCAPPEASPEEKVEALLEHLEQHPKDSETREELARIYAEQYGNIDLAMEPLEELIGMPGQSDRKIVRWMNLMVDLQIKTAGDEAAARKILNRLIRRFPGSAAAGQAQERLEMLPREMKGMKEQSRVIRLGSYQKDLGLKGRDSRLT